MASRFDGGSAPGPRRKGFSRPAPNYLPRPKQNKPVKKAKDDNVIVRSEFPETWIWTEDKIEYVALGLLLLRYLDEYYHGRQNDRGCDSSVTFGSFCRFFHS